MENKFNLEASQAVGITEDGISLRAWNHMKTHAAHLEAWRLIGYAPKYAHRMILTAYAIKNGHPVTVGQLSEVLGKIPLKEFDPQFLEEIRAVRAIS